MHDSRLISSVQYQVALYAALLIFTNVLWFKRFRIYVAPICKSNADVFTENLMYYSTLYHILCLERIYTTKFIFCVGKHAVFLLLQD